MTKDKLFIIVDTLEDIESTSHLKLIKDTMTENEFFNTCNESLSSLSHSDFSKYSLKCSVFFTNLIVDFLDTSVSR